MSWRFLLVVFSMTGLACGGAAAGVGQALSFPAPDTPYLFQRPNGLYDGHGKYLADLGGEADFGDIYVVDASLDRFFLLSPEGHDVVRVATRTGDGFTVTTVLEGARVVRPVGGVAAVKAKGGPVEVIDATGKILFSDLVPAPWDLQVARPEHWWDPGHAYGSAVFCHADDHGDADRTRCGTLKPDGTFQESGWGSPGDAATIGTLTEEGVQIRGKQELFKWNGTLVGGDYELTIVDASGKVSATVPPTAHVELEVEGRSCTDADDVCDYRFHQGRAPVWVRGSAPGALDSAYLGRDGQFAIPPRPCAAKVLSGPFHDDRAFVCDGDGYRMIDLDGHPIAGPWKAWETSPDDWDVDEYPGGLFFSEGLAAVPVDGGWAYVDVDGKTVLPGPYAVARPFRLGIAKVVVGDEVQYLDRAGNRVMEPPHGGAL